MATKLRLQRYGKKARAYYHVVAMDSKTKRDGRIIEQIGVYDPNANPARVELDFDRALYWVKVGAQPSDTVRAMLSYRGVLYKNHLDRGVIKGALTQEQADAKFDKWMEGKSGQIDSKKGKLAKAEADDKAKRFAAETAVKEAIAKKVLAKNSELTADAAAAAPAEGGAAETAAETAAE